MKKPTIFAHRRDDVVTSAPSPKTQENLMFVAHRHDEVVTTIPPATTNENQRFSHIAMTTSWMGPEPSLPMCPKYTGRHPAVTLSGVCACDVREAPEGTPIYVVHLSGFTLRPS